MMLSDGSDRIAEERTKERPQELNGWKDIPALKWTAW